jgi:uncharacterized protein YndB with AHSA1/START domain
MELRPGGSFITQISADGEVFNAPESGCFLAVDEQERIVFTDALAGGWRPNEASFMTAIITLQDHRQGTEYGVHVMHKNIADRKMHEEMGFYDGWGKAAEQLATLVEERS